MIRFKPLFTAAVCAALCLSVQAEADPGDAGVQFDFNQDGVTDEADWSQLRQFALDYAMTEDEVTNFAAQEFPATFMLLVDEWYGNRSSAPNDAEVDAIPEYYLPTVGLSTPVKDQEPFGSCWAFGTISSVESNLLRKRYGHGDTAAASALDLSGVSDEVNLSELYLAYENLQTVTSGSQAGEGATPMSNDINSHFSIGGFASTSQQILTAWDGPVTEEQEPYEPLSAEGDGANVYGLRNEDADRSGTPAAHVQTFLYLDSPSIYHVDLNRKIYAYDRYDADAVQRAKANLYQYGALMVSYSADMSMPGDTGVSKYFDYANWAQFDFSDALNMNHMVSIVGWNDSYPKENFRNEDGVMPESDGAWLVKNSWGNFDQMYASYGEALIDALEGAKGTENEILYNRYYNYGIPDAQGHGSGYFWLSYCDHSITSICAMDADDPADGYDYDHIYQYDHSIPMALTQPVLPTNNTDTRIANVFTASRDETLTAVSAYAPQADCTAEIEVYLLNEETVTDPTKGTKVSTITVPLADRGFHTVPLPNGVSLAEGTVFAVVEKITSSNNISWLNLEMILKPELQTPDNINEVVYTVVANPGETFACVNNGTEQLWVTPDQMNETPAGQVFQFGNARIKAYTVDGLNGSPAGTGSSGSFSDFIWMILAALVSAGAAWAFHKKGNQA